MTSRRKFLAQMSLVGAAIAAPTAAQPAASAPFASAAQHLPLREGWQFRLDPTGASTPQSIPDSESPWQPVSIPHTWQTLGGVPDYVGVAWYRTSIDASAAWQDQFVRVEFEAVFHTAHVFLNGHPIGSHVGKGYTAFFCDLTPALKFGERNELTVRVDNAFSDTMLPRMQSFDWANDGGIIRPVNLLVTPPVFLERILITNTLDLAANTATVSIRAFLRNTLREETSGTLSGLVLSCASPSAQHPLPSKSFHIAPQTRSTVELNLFTLSNPSLWHFDDPNLYEAQIALSAANSIHTLTDTFGIRSFEIRGSAFFLNGEPVRLIGVERMAGSHPQFGMAEPSEWIEANHRDMKELNCIYTRVHWPQDRRVLDFCDRQGILMQQEVPAWGSFTFDKIFPGLQQQLETNGNEQLREMIERDANHPCIVSWGLCNEVDGQNPRTQAFAAALAKQARALDPTRLLTYASNSLSEHPDRDMAGTFDFISANEYSGSWSPGGPPEVRQYLAGIRQAFPGKPIVVSEYGWCECQPKMPPGDEKRVAIITDHTAVFREFPEVAGAIYFDYNDYRTLVGDKGSGALRQRVHGVVDLYARRKPSFQALRLQSSPIEELKLTAAGPDLELEIRTRETLPAYTLRGYRVRWLFYGYDDLPMEGRLDPLPPLHPGTLHTLQCPRPSAAFHRVVVDILRPNGFSASTLESPL